MPEESVTPIVLDTHVWVWLLEGVRSALSAEGVEAVERAGRDGLVRVSAISVWEVAMLEARGRLSFSMPVQEWVRAALRVAGVQLLPLTPEIAIESTRLPGTPHGDPADRILMASARGVKGRLATCDASILDYARSGHLAVLDLRP